jgi:hypothetical protein
MGVNSYSLCVDVFIVIRSLCPLLL